MPTLALIAPEDGVAATQPFEVQVQLTNVQNVSGFEFDLIYDRELIKVLEIAALDGFGVTDECDPNQIRCTVMLGPWDHNELTAVGGYAFGNGEEASGNISVAEIRMEPKGITGTVSIEVINALIATSDLSLAITPETKGATFVLGKGNKQSSAATYLPFIAQDDTLPIVSESDISPLFAPLDVASGGAVGAGSGPDIDGNGQVNVIDVVHVAKAFGATPGTTMWNVNLDLDVNNRVDTVDIDRVAQRWKRGLTRLVSSSPLDGESDIAVTRETVFEFSHPLDAATVQSAFAATSGGRPLSARIHLSPDERRVTLFYHTPLSANATVAVAIDGTKLRDSQGYLVDLTSDGLADEHHQITFETLGLTLIPNTSICGTVLASERSAGTTADVPLSGATITVDGMESTLRTTTDDTGRFCLDPAPSGRFFAHVDGRTATNAVPNGAYYPFVGKPWTAQPGRQTEVGHVYLPMVQPGTLQAVSADEDTTIRAAASIIADNPAFTDVTITVPADSLFANNGSRGGQVGIAPVPPDRLPGTLPEGLEFPVVITVQTDGPTNFDTPAPVCFPNLPDPVTGALPEPGSKEELYSFNHDSGQWEAAGSMTVSQDGQLVCTDPEIGIRAPGWHGSGPSPYGPGPNPNPLPPLQCMATVSAQQLVPNAQDDELDKCLQKCESKGHTCVTKCALTSLVPFALCALGTGPAFPLCAGGVIAGAAVCAGLCVYDTHECAEDCNNKCPAVAAQASLVERGMSPSNEEVINAVHQLTQQAQSLTYDHVMAGEPLPENVVAQVQMLIDQANALADGDALAFILKYLRDLEQENLPLTAEVGEPSGNAPPYPVRYVADVVRAGGTSLKIRGKTAANGEYSIFVPRDGTLVSVSFYDSQANAWGQVHPNQRPGARNRLPRFYLKPIDDSFPDFDGDALPDVVEFIYATDTNNPDTDGDGVTDGAEVAQGTNPTDGFVIETGVIGAVDTAGYSYALCIENDIAVLAEGSSNRGSRPGVTIVDVSEPLMPVLLGRLDTRSAGDVACAGERAVVADGLGGLLIIDITDPNVPQILHEISLGEASNNFVEAIVTDGRYAYFSTAQIAVGQGNGLLGAVDLQTGVLHEMLTLPEGMKSLAISENRLAGLDGRYVNLFQIVDGRPLFMSRIAHNRNPFQQSFVRSQIGLDGSTLYYTHFDGYDTLDISDLRNPTLLGRSSEQFGTNRGLALGGTGAVLITLSRGPSDWAVAYFDGTNPTNTDANISEFPVPEGAYEVLIYKGLAYVANGEDGLQVINFQQADRAGIAPTVSVSLGGTKPPGVIGESGSSVLVATVADDAQIQQVDFFVDGMQAASDMSAPFEYLFSTPASSQQISVTIQARATDTGGNRGESPQTTLMLVPDATAPEILQVAPISGTLVMTRQVDSIAVRFSEAMDASSLTGETLILFDESGVVINGAVTYDGATRTGHFRPSLPLAIGTYHAEVTTGVKDQAGHALLRGASWSFEVVAPVRWVGAPGATNWNDRSNWSGGARPGPKDYVLIDVPSAAPSDVVSITLTAGGTIYGIISEEPLLLAGGNLQLTGQGIFNHNVTVANSARLGSEQGLVFNRDLHWRSGELYGIGGSTVYGTLLMDTASDKYLGDNHRLNVAQEAIWQDGRIVLNGPFLPSGQINILSGARFDIQSDGVMIGEKLLINNAGTVVKSAGDGQTIIHAAVRNEGILSVESGEIVFKNEVVRSGLGSGAAKSPCIWPELTLSASQPLTELACPKDLGVYEQ
ncbi:MAG: Ig-like domain-containing protein [Chloroflexota bacterium]